MAMQRAVIEQLRQQDQEQQRRIKELEAETAARIQKTLANPLAGKD
jgi:membrane protein involved in colicin uptake